MSLPEENYWVSTDTGVAGFTLETFREFLESFRDSQRKSRKEPDYEIVSPQEYERRKKEWLKNQKGLRD